MVPKIYPCAFGNGGSMTAKQIIKKLENNGWKFVRQVGSHKHYRKVGNPNLVTVPDHGSKDISIGVIKRIERDTGLSF